MKNTTYQSEAMQFINTLLEKPGAYEHRMKLRSTWWSDREIDQKEEESNQQSEVKHDSYVYFSYDKLK